MKHSLIEFQSVPFSLTTPAAALTKTRRQYRFSHRPDISRSLGPQTWSVSLIPTLSGVPCQPDSVKNGPDRVKTTPQSFRYWAKNGFTYNRQCIRNVLLRRAEVPPQSFFAQLVFLGVSRSPTLNMALSDEEKALIKEEIATLTKEQADNLHASKEAGLELKAQATDQLAGVTKAALELKAQATDQLAGVTKAALELKAQVAEQSAAHEKLKTQAAEQLTAHERLMQELRNYRIVIKWITGSLIGGSILAIGIGIANFLPFIDRSIGDRLVKTYELNLGLALANTGSWRDALQNIDKIYDEIKAAKVDASRQFRDFLYGTMIWIMAQDDVIVSEDTWGGQNEWTGLWKDDDFSRNYLSAQWLRSYDSDNNNLAICVLKFDRTDDALKKAQEYFRRAIVASNDLPVKKSPRLFGLAMIDLINGDQDGALAKIKEAGRLDPASYTPTDFAKNKSSYKNSNDYRIYNVAARRRSIDFGPRLDALVDRINAEANPPKPENK